jgi:hypothetical protein
MNAAPRSGGIPTREEVMEFEAELAAMCNPQIADKRYTGAWGPYDPTDPRNSSWKVRLANRELTNRKEKRERNLAWWAIGGAFITGWIAIIVAALAIPLEAGKSIYCRLDPFNLCISEGARAVAPPPGAPAAAPIQRQ